MALEIIDYIGNTIKNNNSYFDNFHINGVQLPSGEVIQFTDQKEKEFIGIGDNLGTAFYIRFNPNINHQTGERKISSLKSGNSSVKQCRLVAYSWNKEITSEGLMNKLITDLRSIKFSNYEYSRRPIITLKKSNHFYLDNVKEESKKDFKEIGQEFVCVSIDFDLKYFPSECDPCFIEKEPSCNYDF